MAFAKQVLRNGMDLVPHLGTVGEVDGPPDRNGYETFPFISEPHPHRYYAL